MNDWLRLAAEVAQTGSMLEQLAAPILGSAALILAGAITLIGTFRTSGRAAQTQREAQQSKRDAELDERADKQYAASQAEVARLIALVDQRERERDEARDACDQARVSRDDYRERYAALRVSVRSAGFDPDTIGGQEGGNSVNQP